MSEKVQQLLVIFVGAIVVTGVIYVQVRRSRPAPPVRSAAALSEVEPATSVPPAIPAAPEPMGAVQPTPGPALEATEEQAALAVLMQTGEWGRNPFLTLGEIAALAPEPIVFDIVDIPTPVLTPPPAQADTLPDYKVTVIVSGENGNWAVIGSRLVRPGDRLGAETVKQINDNGVILELNGQTREVRIDRPGLIAPGGSRRSNE